TLSLLGARPVTFSAGGTTGHLSLRGTTGHLPCLEQDRSPFPAGARPVIFPAGARPVIFPARQDRSPFLAGARPVSSSRGSLLVGRNPYAVAVDQPGWWQRGLVYQIYPRSFQDTNDDGVGDLPGITQRLDYLHWLGVDAIWISPIFPSPMADFGYDVADYCDVDPLFGTLEDFDRPTTAAHARDIKVIA